MTYRIVPSLLILASLSLVFGPAANADIMVTSDASIKHVVDEISTFQVDGDDMSGMLVSVTFADTTTSSAPWATTGVGAGAAGAAGWSLSLSGDTFFGGQNWVLSNTSGQGIVGFSINAEVAGIVFDIVAGPSLTEGSSDGAPFFAGSSDDALAGTATYKHAIAVTNPHLGVHKGDIFGILDVVITRGEIASSRVDTFTFRADTDIISQAVPEASQVIALSMVGLICAGTVWWKRRPAAAPVRA